MQCWLHDLLVYGCPVWACATSMMRALRIFIYYTLADKKASHAHKAMKRVSRDPLIAASVSPSESDNGTNESSSRSTSTQLGILRYQKWFTERNFVLTGMALALVSTIAAFTPHVDESMGNWAPHQRDASMFAEACPASASRRRILAIAVGAWDNSYSSIQYPSEKLDPGENLSKPLRSGLFM